MKSIFLTIFIALGCYSGAQAAPFRLQTGKQVRVVCPKEEKPVVHTALRLLARDVESVLDGSLLVGEAGGDIVVANLQSDGNVRYEGVDLSALQGKKQAFLLAVLPKGQLLIAGSDSHGVAYGIMEVSRLLGVSPWEWWADVTPAERDTFELPEGYRNVQAPSVEYRGIFINDEDWGLMPWSSRYYEPGGEPGRIGPRTNERIFELLLRLRANTYWPAMHECTLPFFLTEGNREVAERFGIYIGGSHCEPMASSTAGEWPRRGTGEYNYVNNSEAVRDFWEERVKEVAGQEILYTLGMRGVHDGKMQGAKTVDEQKAVLQRAIGDQRALLQRYVNADVTKVPQVFIPYKEVLDIYRAGLQVPDDVTLMWCDDNYGYIRHFPTPGERKRKGGNGIYYHASYWGRPHDYLWLGTFSPALMYQQMTMAYDRGIQKMWVLNVGDIKPIEYQTELFLDMAWDMEGVRSRGVTEHLRQYLQRELGTEAGNALLPLMQEHYRLAYVRRPEFMGNTRVEEAKTTDHHIVKDLPWGRDYLKGRLAAYQTLSDQVESLWRQVPEGRKDAFFQLAKYPIQAAAQMNRKFITAQLARHGEGSWQESDAAFDSIAVLTRLYNEGFHNGGKWKGIMDFQPRKLPVFDRVPRTSVAVPLADEPAPLYQWNAVECTEGRPTPCEGLGYEGKAASVAKGDKLVFAFDSCPTDSVEVRIACLPSHPVVDGGALRVAVGLDGGEWKELSFQTQGRSEEWKLNILANQAVKTVRLPIARMEGHRLTVRALDAGVVLDQIKVYAIEP